MSTSMNLGPSARQRGPAKGTPSTPTVESANGSIIEKSKAKFHKTPGPQWDYRIAFAVVVALAFVTRFYGISYPREVVFDEVHFGKVRGTAVRA